MWRSSRKAFGLRRGFTLIEAMVSLLLLVIVLTVAMSMLFQMRAFAERQQFFMRVTTWAGSRYRPHTTTLASRTRKGPRRVSRGPPLTLSRRRV